MNKKAKKIIFIIIFLIGYSSVWIYLSPQLLKTVESYVKFDPNLQHMITTILVSGAGGSLFALRNITQKSSMEKNALPKNKIKREVLERIEAIELLILIVIPSVEAFSFILKTFHYYPLALVPYVCASAGWFILVVKLHERFQDPKQEKNFWIYHSYLMSVLFLFGILAFWMLNTYSQISQHIPI